MQEGRGDGVLKSPETFPKYRGKKCLSCAREERKGYDPWNDEALEQCGTDSRKLIVPIGSS